MSEGWGWGHRGQRPAPGPGMAVHPGMISARTSLRALAIIPLAVVLLGWLGVQIGVRLFFRARLLHYDNLSGSGSDWSDSSSDEDDDEEDGERAFWAQGARGAAAPVEGAEAPAVGRACAAHHFAGERESDLSFVRGDEVELLDASADDWWRGRLRDGTEGTFPANFVERVEIFPTGPVAREDEELQPAPRTRTREPETFSLGLLLGLTGCAGEAVQGGAARRGRRAGWPAP